MFLAVFMVASLAVIPSSAATPKLSKTSVTLTKGYTTTLSVSGNSGTVKWSTGDKSIATVTSKGKVAGKAPGTTYIYAKVDNKTLKCKVTVVASKITANKSSVVLDKTGDTATVTLTVKGSHGIAMTSSNKSVAKGSFTTSSFNGNNISVKITAYGAGDATIKIYNKNYPSCYKNIYVTVNKDPEPENNFIMPATSSVSVGVGENYTLRVGAQNQNNLTYTVSNTSVATVTAGTASGNYRNYTIKGVAAGTTTLRFYDKNNTKVYEDVTITVTNDLKYYEFYTTYPTGKLLGTDQVIEVSPTVYSTKYYMLVPANYDSAKVNALKAEKFGSYEYYTVYESIPKSKIAATDTYESFYHTNSKYTYGVRYVLVPAKKDEVKYNTAVAKYNGKYEYYVIYNESPAKDTWDNIETWNVLDSATGRTVTRYMLVPYNVDRSKADAIKQKDQEANKVYQYYTAYTTYPTVNTTTDSVIMYRKNNSYVYMIVPKNDANSVIKANDAILKDTGVYEYNVMYSTAPTNYDLTTEGFVPLTSGNTTYYILYKIYDANGNVVNANTVISTASNTYADGIK